MVATVAIVVFTHNLAYGVGAGSCCRRCSSPATCPSVVKVTSVVDPDNVERLYAVSGELFFASTNDLVHAFDYDAVKVERVEIDLTDARIWDTSAVAALDTVVARFAERGIDAEADRPQPPRRTAAPAHAGHPRPALTRPPQTPHRTASRCDRAVARSGTRFVVRMSATGRR